MRGAIATSEPFNLVNILSPMLAHEVGCIKIGKITTTTGRTYPHKAGVEGFMIKPLDVLLFLQNADFTSE